MRNRAEFIGNLGADARAGTTTSGTPVVNFSIAVNEKRSGEETTTWVSCALFGKPAETLGKYLTKGKQVLVAGPVRISEYTTKDGEVRRELSVFVNDIELLGGAGGGERRPAASDDPFA